MQTITRRGGALLLAAGVLLADACRKPNDTQQTAAAADGAMNAALLATGFSGKVFTDVDAALDWLTELPGQTAELRRAVPDVRRAVRDLTR